MKTRARKKAKTSRKRAPNAPCSLPGVEVAKSLNGLSLPTQFFLPATESYAHWSGSRRLMLSVLQDALTTWHRYRRDPSTRGQRLFRETQEWFWSADESWLYTFENVCKHLDLDPDSIRERLVGRQATPARGRAQGMNRHSSSPSRIPALAA